MIENNSSHSCCNCKTNDTNNTNRNNFDINGLNITLDKNDLNTKLTFKNENTSSSNNTTNQEKNPISLLNELELLKNMNFNIQNIIREKYISR